MKPETVHLPIDQEKNLKLGRNGRGRPWKNAVAGFLVLALVSGLVLPAAAQTPSQVGGWEGPYDWPLVAVHMMLLPTGQVLTFDGPPVNGGGSARLWNPSTGLFTPVPNPTTDLFCVGQAPMADGRMFLAGGHFTPGVGLQEGNIYDPVTRGWTLTAQMAFPRWYPTVTTLPDGRLLVTSGSQSCETCIADTPEVYNPRTNTWTQLPGANLPLPLYPMMYVLPNGRVLAAGSVREAIPTRVLDVATQTWSMVDPNVVDGHSSVMYLPGKIMKSGTASDVNLSTAPSSSTTYLLDMTAPSPAWRATASMSFSRAFHNLTILPDGTVLATSGGGTMDGVDYSNAVLPAELWNPTTERWTTMASMQNPRLYHSTALLLPDGRILVAGSGRLGAEPQLNAEIYSPPYLFKGARPTVTSAPASAAYGRTVFVGTPDGSQIASVSLIGLGNVTHSFDTGQHFNRLTFSQTTGGLNVQMPANANLATPGYYMLFLVNGAGVPSVAKIMLVGEDSDNDNLLDAWEVRFFSNLTHVGGGDFDGDGLTNAQELAAGTSPVAADSDGDGGSDGAEVTAGSDPLDPASTLAALISTPSALTFLGAVGGGPSAPRTLTVTNSGPGALGWTASSNRTWLSVSPGSGTTPGSLNVTVSPAGLAIGTYTGHVILTSAVASNSPYSVPVTLIVNASGQGDRYDFVYPNRSALFADGWDFTALTAGGAPRDTEQAAGTVVSYDQALHPGTLRVPAGPGDLWAGGNDSGNTLFRDLPSNWTSVRLKIAAFAPNSDYQGACLIAYQNDDNYVAVCRDYVRAQTVEWWQESAGSPTTLALSPNAVTANLLLRLDRNIATDTLTAFISTDNGATWLALSGSTVKPMTAPRLGILVGANTSTVSFPAADLAFVEILHTGPLPSSIKANPASLDFEAIPGGANPSSRTLNITNGGSGPLNWSVSADQPWVTLTPAGGAAPGAVTVGVVTAGLAAGSYRATITITSPEGSNSPFSVPVTLTMIGPAETFRFDFTYPDRAALFADGWNFLARTAAGATRNTERVTGLVASYDQTLHPGVLQVPVDLGELWAGNNDSRNTLFRALPADWSSIRMKIQSFAPAGNYEAVCLLAYQDDDNYAALCRDFVNSQIVEWWQESDGGPDVVGNLSSGTTSNLILRLDRNPLTETLTGFISTNNGSTWTPLPGSAAQPLTAPRLGIFIGGNITTSYPNADLAFVEILTGPLEISPASLSFSAVPGGGNPPSKTVAVSKIGDGAVNWNATVDQPWLTVSPASGAAPGSATVTVSTAGLAPGDYTATITFSSPQAPQKTRSVPVALALRPPTLGFSPSSFTFEWAQTTPAPASQTLTVNNLGGGGLTYAVSDNQPWLTLSPVSGTAPGSVVLSVSTAGLSLGTYNAAITVTSSQAVNSPQTVPVTFVVNPPPPILNTSPSTISFSGFTGGAQPPSQTISVTNTGGSPLHFTVSGNQPWLSVSPASGTAPAAVAVNVSTAGLSPGTYQGAVTINAPGATGSPRTIPVTLTMTLPPSLSLSPTGLGFTAIQGGPGPAAQAVSVIDDNNGPMNWTASANQPWISLSPASGVGSGTMTVTVSNAGLTAGTYSGAITVAAPSAPNSPKTIAVSFNVAAPASLGLSQSSFTFGGVQGGPSPAAQTVSVANSGGGAMVWSASVSHPWVVLSQTSGTALSAVSVRASTTGLAAGTYHATVTVTAPGAANSPRSIAITLVVDPPAPALRASPISLSFGAMEGGASPGPQTVTVSDFASGALAWSAAADQPWIAVSPSSGSTPGSVTVTVTSNGFPPGTYSGTVALTSGGAANSPLTVPVSLTVFSSQSGRLGLGYPNRAALLADGWDFVARTASGVSRNTEQATGFIVDYDQSSHPGTIRIPTDVGTPWAGNNNNRNTLFRDLPADWQSVRMKIASYVPTNLYHSACLLAYQNDDNYVALCRDFVGSQTIEWWHEAAAVPTVMGTVGNTATSNVVLRIDRNPATNLITAFMSTDDGVTWGALPGGVTKALAAPRLGIFIGGNVSSAVPSADLAYVEWIGGPPSLGTHVNSLTFGGATAGPSPGSQLLAVTNSGSGSLTWTASVNQPWLTLSAASGSAPAIIAVNASTAGLSSGTYSGTISLVSPEAFNSPKSVPVTLTVSSPSLIATPNSLSFGATVGSSPAPQAVTISNSAGGSLNWTATVDQPWLSVSAASGTAPNSTTLSVSSSGLAAGTYDGTVTFTAAEAANSPVAIPVSLVMSPTAQTTRIGFNYGSRSALFSGDWDFFARTALGALRNTEQTFGLVIDYNQTAHPGMIRIPTDQGTPWAGNNNTRNTLFRNLPTDWESIRVKFASFAPTEIYQSACLLAYQNDDNYVALCRDFVGSNTIEWWHEAGAVPSMLGTVGSTATANIVFRIDRNRVNNTMTAFFSTNGGTSWTQMSGSVMKVLSNPRLGIFVGGNASGSVPYASVEFAEIVAVPAAPQGQSMTMSPGGLSFSGLSGGTNPASQSVTVGGSGFTWNASADRPWISVSPGSGGAPGALKVNVSLSGLAPGSYRGAVTLTSAGATNSPQVVPIHLTVLSLSEHRLLSAAVLVNGANTAGYNASPLTPGEFQRYSERYLEHLQVPYDIIDISTTPPPADFFDRQLIIASHRGLNPDRAWQDAITNAVALGTGFINLDWDPAVGMQSHVQAVFGATGSQAGAPGQAITVPASVVQGGSAPHYIAALQRRFLGDPAGDLVYFFHPDAQNIQQTVQSTVLTGSKAEVIARIGSDPLIVANAYGAGRVVHVGSLEYLKADRFGFLKGLDDLFWRSLVWAARKPFIVRGYPKLWSLQIDDTVPGFGERVRDMYDPALTGPVSPNGTGGPWKVTGYLYTENMLPGSGERESVAADIAGGMLEVSPHSFFGTAFGDIYWNGFSGPPTDAQWQNNVNETLDWMQGSGGSDTLPISRSLVAHFWDLGNNTGWDLWNRFGFRYLTSIQRPGFQRLTEYNGQERFSARPFWIYEKPPKRSPDEDHPFFFADDITIGSRAGLPAQTMFLFTTQVQGIGSPRPDVTWPANATNPSGIPWSVEQSTNQFELYTWRLWSSMAPVQIFTHDTDNYILSTVNARRTVIQNVSTWLNGEGAKHRFMDDFGDYVYARTKSVLTRSELAGGNVTHVFTGSSATADGALIATELKLYLGDDEGTGKTVPGFSGGRLITQPVGGS